MFEQEICTSVCDNCSYSGPGIMCFQLGDPFLFQCLLCVPEDFESIYEEDIKRVRSHSQNEKSSGIKL